MKKTLAILLAAAVLIAVSACSKKKEGTSETVEPTEAQETARSETAAEGAETSSAAESRASLPADGEWQESFKFVRDAIRTEPSRYPLKTADGVEWGRSANPLEKTLFLARLLQEKGMTVEIAEGELDDATARSLVGAIFPSAKAPSYKSGTPISNPAEDRNLVAAVKRHFWVRLEEEDGWVDLDPSFPSAEPGKAFAELADSYDPADEALGVKVSLSVSRREIPGGRTESVLSWDGMLAEVVNKPVSLTVMTEYRGGEAEAKEKEEEAGGGVGGLFGGLSGGTSEAKKKPAGGAEAYLKITLMTGEDSLAEGEVAAEEGSEAHLILKVKFESLGEVVSGTDRDLFKAAVGRTDAPLFQRHALLVTGDRIPAAAWKDDVQALSAADARSEAKAEADEIRAALKAKKATARTLSSGVELEARLGRDLGHLVNMIFASTSDDQTEKAAAALSVASWYAVPRVIITSFGGSEKGTEATIDLRQDRVASVALPGQAWGMSQAFQYGRGVMESILEGKLLTLLTEKPALTTAFIMEEAARKSIPIRMFSSLEKDQVKSLGAPPFVRGWIEGALASESIIIVPEKPISWEGRPRWGWWLVDPRTRETIGVLDTGLHQAMLEHTILQEKGAMSTKMGAVLGAMVGAVDTYWLLMGMILKHGELTKEALLEAKAYMKDIQSVMCPGFEKKISIEASVSLIDIEDCFKYDYEIYKAEAGVSISQGWCDQFAKGFACASTSILNYYLSQFED